MRRKNTAASVAGIVRQHNLRVVLSRFFAMILRMLFLTALSALACIAHPYEQLLKQLRAAKVLSCRFVNAAGETISLVAARNGKLRLESRSRTVVCNGTTVWNYAPAQNLVTISPYKPTATASFERILFELVEMYTPTEHDQQHVVLRPTAQPLYGVQSIRLEFQGIKLSAVAIEHSVGKERWRIYQLRFNPPVAPTIFEFTPPPGVEQISLQ